MITVEIKYFGPARDFAGLDSERIELTSSRTVGSLAGILAERHERLGNAPGVRLAVNRTYVPLDHILHDGDEVAVIPPVSGG